MQIIFKMCIDASLPLIASGRLRPVIRGSVGGLHVVCLEVSTELTSGEDNDDGP